jgi:hypothetical protein
MNACTHTRTRRARATHTTQTRHAMDTLQAWFIPNKICPAVQVGLGMDRASPRAERGSKLVGPVSRIIYGLRIQEDRVGLDWPIKGLGQVDARFNARGSSPRIPNGSSQYPRDGRREGSTALDDREGAETGVDGRHSAITAPPWCHFDLLLLR